jgi:RHS repeat-associated protein
LEENGVKTFYVYGLGLIGDETDGEYRAYHFDFRGSTVALTNQTGKVVERFQYGPYGELVKGDTAVTPFLFNGKYGVMSDGNGLYYMRARFYSAAIKRFVNQDVLLGNLAEGQTLNRFAFVTGRPVNWVDPFGFDGIQPELLNPTITKEQLDDLFNQKIKQLDLALNRPSTGCEARAYLISKAIKSSLYQPYQVWLFHDRHKLTIKGKDYGWHFHTANMVKLPDGTRMVIDLIVSPGKPITVAEWKEYFSNVQNSSEEKFGIPPMRCEGAPPCGYHRVRGSYTPFQKDSEFSSLEEQAKNTLACLKDVDTDSLFLGAYLALRSQHCRAIK